MIIMGYIATALVALFAVGAVGYMCGYQDGKEDKTWGDFF